MMQQLRTVTIAIAFGWALTASAAAPAVEPTWVEGRNYFLVIPQQRTQVPPGKVEVTEVFSYGCPACNQFNPWMRQLKASLPANAQVDYVPAGFNTVEDWPMFQRAYCTALLLGISEKTHDAMFDAIWNTGELGISDPQTHRLKSPLPSIEDAARFYNRLTGVPVDKFVATAKSFAVDVKLKSYDTYALVTHVDGTPTLIVNGKYRLSPGSAGGANEAIALVNYLVKKETH